MANLVKIIETSDDIQTMETAINAAIAALTPAAGSDVIVMSDGGLHRCRIFISYRT